jgi:hypothetical protein
MKYECTWTYFFPIFSFQIHFKPLKQESESMSNQPRRWHDFKKKTEKMTRMPRLEPVSGSTGGSYGNSGREATSSLYSSATSSYIRFPLSCGHATIYKPEKRIQRGERMRTPHHIQARWYRAHDRHRLCRGIWPMQSVSFKKTDYLAL